MFRHIVFRNFRDPVWSKVTTLGTTLFLIFLADAILSFWLPNYMQEVLGSAFLMGLFLSFSSVVGIAVDMFLPQIIKGITVHNLLTLGIVSGGLFALLLLYLTWIPAAFVFLIAMAVWGIYYEFFGFAEQQFVADATPLRMHSAVWAILGIFKNLAYFLGPLMAGYLVLGGERMPVVGAMIYSTCGFITLVASKGVHKRPVKIDTEEVSLRKEIGHWRTLFGRIWPVLTLSMLMGLVDATYWTTGTVLTAKLAQKNILGSLFLPAYMLPTLFVGIVIAKKKIYAGKKKMAELAFLASSIILLTLVFSNSVVVMVVIVFASSTFLSASYPLVDGVYSDIVARMGRERRHLIGLTRSSLSFAYIIGPALAGGLASLTGEINTFVIVGFVGAVVSAILLVTTPKKLKLPQEDIHKWD